MGWQFAYHGYRINHGGVLIASQTTHTVDGVPNSRMGDVSYCPLCKRNVTIIDGDLNYTIYGKPAAYVGGTLSCGAKILQEGTTRSFRGDDGGTSPRSTFVAVPTKKPHFIKYLILSEDGTKFLQNEPYSIEVNGKVYSGTTDAQGYTESIEDPQSFNATINV